jgi:hypothetical protein
MAPEVTQTLASRYQVHVSVQIDMEKWFNPDSSGKCNNTDFAAWDSDEVYGLEPWDPDEVYGLGSGALNDVYGLEPDKVMDYSLVRCMD